MTTKFYFTLLAFILVPAFGYSVQLEDNLVNRITIIKARLRGPLTDVRVIVMKIGPDIAVDPPPDERSFEKFATATVALNCSYYPYKEPVLKVLNELQKAKLSPTSNERYGRWCVKFVASWNEILGEFLIDSRNNCIKIGPSWYQADRLLITRLTTDLLALTQEEKSHDEPTR